MYVYYHPGRCDRAGCHAKMSFRVLGQWPDVGSSPRIWQRVAVLTTARDTRRSAVKDRPTVKTARVYDPPAPDDGMRVLVDRVWPRGLTKEKAHVEEWCKQVAPSTELRKWYGHTPALFAEFSHRYRAELDDPERAEALRQLRALSRKRTLTLVTATKAVEISQAAVLADVVRGL